jgi:hypothetical protein
MGVDCVVDMGGEGRVFRESVVRDSDSSALGPLADREWDDIGARRSWGENARDGGEDGRSAETREPTCITACQVCCSWAARYDLRPDVVHTLRLSAEEQMSQMRVPRSVPDVLAGAQETSCSVFSISTSGRLALPTAATINPTIKPADTRRQRPSSLTNPPASYSCSSYTRLMICIHSYSHIFQLHNDVARYGPLGSAAVVGLAREILHDQGVMWYVLSVAFSPPPTVLPSARSGRIFLPSRLAVLLSLDAHFD